MDVELKEQFDDLGIEPNSEVLTKCMDLCITYNEDAVAFVEQWVAFSISNLNNQEPTLDNLVEFERKVFQSRGKEFASKSKAKYNSNRSSLNISSNHLVESNPLAIYGIERNDIGNNIDDGMGDNDDIKVLDAYNVVHTPKTKSGLARTPARHKEALFSPARYSPISGTPRTHTATAGSGKIVYTFGNPTLIDAAQWAAPSPAAPVSVKQLLLHDGEPLSSATGKYGFDCLRESAEIAGDRIFHIGQRLCRKVFGADPDDYELMQVDMHSQEVIKTIGTIACDHEGRLDGSSTLLIGSDEMRARTVRLNFSKAKSVSLFPGQIVIVSGVNPRGDVFMVNEIFAEKELPPPTPPRFADQLSFVVTAGPYTHDDDLVYDPLHDLMEYLKSHRPNVLIMMGPFLHADHKQLNENFATSFEAFFEKMIAGIVDIIGSSTTLLIVASQNDAHADPVYPTMPYALKKSYPNVHMLADPSMIDLNGIVIGMTSTDVVEHIVSRELAINAGDKVKRVVNYLLHQGSFYPLRPPAEEKVALDSSLANRYANIEQVPNILLLPSDQKPFIRMVNGCLAINPGRLTDNSGGTFARFIITPPSPKDENNMFNYVGCQVRKV